MNAIPESRDSGELRLWAGALEAANHPTLTESLGTPEMARILIESVEGLPRRARLVLTLHYYEGLSFCEIGGVLDIRESRVCQLHTLSFQRLTHAVKGQLGGRAA